jgi:hypothetical protein
MDTFQGWTATLSNGENAWEQPPVAGEKSSWQKLLDRLDKDNLKITSLRVQRGGITLHALPAKQCEGYFQAYDQHTSMFNGNISLQQGCGSIVEDKIFIMWVDTNNNVHSEVRPLMENSIHTTLRHK